MRKGMLIKVCGMLYAENIQDIERLSIDMMGFIFYPKSPRNVLVRPKYLPSSVKRVGVFVDAELEYIKQKIEEFNLDIVQLHGDESPCNCCEVSKMGVEVIKAFQIGSEKDFARTLVYESVCNYLLFDTQTENKGGSGRCFDWKLLDCYKGSTPFILSGGISVECTENLNHLIHPMLVGYDLNSKFEEYPGFKSVSKLTNFINKI